jgi:hypothetical protein
MRSATLTFVFLGLTAGQILAMGNHRQTFAYLSVVNQADAAVSVKVNASVPVVLEPLASKTYAFAATGGQINVTITATLVDSTSVTASKKFALLNGDTATISSPTPSSLAITVKEPIIVVSNRSRESRVAAASAGGLLPLLLVSCLLGRSPRKRKQQRPDAELNSTPVAPAC